jgi:hypothetical protein
LNFSSSYYLLQLLYIKLMIWHTHWWGCINRKLYRRFRGSLK